nr:glycosyltransferase family 39 protein [Kibdelosporangium sp. MJ126-NF4]CEL20869.1 Dolichyl-phosphate-mannose-protein mannosyltransferase family [Kibdelosporangium sp. MJ126-NF4]CTQ98326.1 Dolichyl-phosphate-mannose-protein mannosyltransferase family [Kibdelosporangium sp. MJ126-NF4]
MREVARRSGLALLVGATVVVLLAFTFGYGYHRDELYFLAAGQHLAWAYADQGPLTPFIARVTSEIWPGSLFVLRIPSALMAGGTVLLTGLLARELGGSRRAELIAATCAALSSVVLFNGHFLSTSTADLLVWTAISWLVVRAVRTGNHRLWLVVGVVLGIGLLNKSLPAFLMLGLLVGVVIAGPRELLRNRYVWLGAVIAVVLWLPWIVWQAGHSWPQFDVSRSIAAGGSTSSQPWWAIIPYQFLLVSPVLAPVWIAGLVRLFTGRFRFVAWAWVVLAVVFMATGGKPYYLAGLLPALLGAGAVQVDTWLANGRRKLRRGVLIAAVVSGALVNAVITLPILPADRAGIVVALNGDVGEMIGWPEFAQTVADVRRTLPTDKPVVIVTRNYGQAGAIDRYGPALGLPQAYSGHNAYSSWGPPPDSDSPVIAIGRGLAPYLRDCRTAAQIRNRAGIENNEWETPVLVCAGPRLPWSQQWTAMRHYG